MAWDIDDEIRYRVLRGDAYPFVMNLFRTKLDEPSQRPGVFRCPRSDCRQFFDYPNPERSGPKEMGDLCFCPTCKELLTPASKEGHVIRLRIAKDDDVPGHLKEQVRQAKTSYHQVSR